MSRIDEAASLRFVLLLALASATMACSAPYRSFHGMSAGVALSKPIPGTRSVAPMGHVGVGAFEFGDVKGGLRPSWSVVGYPLELDGGERSFRVSTAAVGGRLYVFSHFVKGGLEPIRGLTWVNKLTRSRRPVLADRAVYQVFGTGIDVKIAPLAFGIKRGDYDGFGEAALFATAAIPYRIGVGLEFRVGTQYAVDSGGTLFARLELAMLTSRKRNLTQAEEKLTNEEWKLSDEELQKRRQTEKAEEEFQAEKATKPLRPEGFGFEFDAGPDEAASSCQNAGYEWSEKEGVFVCSGVPSFKLESASAELSFANGQISRLRIFVRTQNDRGDWIDSKSTTEAALESMYGESKSMSFSVPEACSGNDFMDCVIDGKVTGETSWMTKTRSVTLAIVSGSPPTLVVDIKRER